MLPAEGPRMLSAQWASPDVYLVFSEPLAASSVAAQRFVVALSDGSRVVPVAASFAPASEADELHTVRLRLPPDVLRSPDGGPPDGGQDVDHTQNPIVPISVTLTGMLHTSEGTAIEGLSAAVSTSEIARPVWAQWLLPAVGRCSGYAQVVRLYFSRPLPSSPQATEAAAPGAGPTVVKVASTQFRGTLQTGKSQAPAGFDDLDGESSQPRVDNVLDLCFEQPAKVAVVEVSSDGVHPLQPPVSVAVAGVSLRR